MLRRLRERHKERIEEVTENPEPKKVFSLNMIRNLKIAYIPYNELLKEGIIAGIGWAIGVTIGFVVVSTIIVFILNALGGLPFVGRFFASVVQETQSQLLKRSPIVPQ